MDNISSTGWIIIIGLAIFILTLNFGLFMGVRQKMEKDNWIDKLTNAGKVLRNPSQKEDEQYRLLSEQVAKLKSAQAVDNESRQPLTHEAQGEK